jgi:2-oxoglutarate ferredoxin oxidoreductase subunit beta
MGVITGIGCTGRVGGYLNMDSVHATHGRALPIATGASLVRPDMKFVVFLGDGDGIAIGGNHLIHSANRNINLTAILLNNMVYGLTGGQSSPTTPEGARTSTAPLGSAITPFNISRVVAACGAKYVARWTVLYPREIKESIKKALQFNGFGFIEVLSPCPEEFGRKNNLREVMKLNEWILQKTIPVDRLSSEQKFTTDKLVIGEIVNEISSSTLE